MSDSVCFDVLSIGHPGIGEHSFKYDVTAFARDVSETWSDDWIGRANDYVVSLSEELETDVTTVNKLKRDILTVAGALAEHIARSQILSEYVSDVSAVAQGSFFAGLRVGLPFEGDVMIAMTLKESVNEILMKPIYDPELDERVYSTRLYLFRKYNDACAQFFEKHLQRVKLKHCRVLVVKRHKLGHCAYFEFKEKPLAKTRYGLQIDLIPTYVTGEDVKIGKLKPEAVTMLQSWGWVDGDGGWVKKKAGCVQAYFLFSPEKGSEGSEYVEHNMLTKLARDDSRLKHAYRVAKLLLHRVAYVKNSESLYEHFIVAPDRWRCDFGDDPYFRSYFLQQCFLLLVTNIRSTSLEQQVLNHPALLCVCVLDVMCSCVNYMTHVPPTFGRGHCQLAHGLTRSPLDFKIPAQPPEFYMTSGLYWIEEETHNYHVWTCLVISREFVDLSCVFLAAIRRNDVTQFTSQLLPRKRPLLTHLQSSERSLTLEKRLRFDSQLYKLERDVKAVGVPYDVTGFCRGASLSEMADCGDVMIVKSAATVKPSKERSFLGFLCFGKEELRRCDVIVLPFRDEMRGYEDYY